MEELDGIGLLGAADALAKQYIVLRIKSIDREKLKQAIGSSGMLASSGLMFVDAAPKAALDAVVPIVVGKARDYGVDLEASVTDAPQVKGKRAISEFWPGLGIGVGVGASALLIAKGIGGLITLLTRR